LIRALIAERFPGDPDVRRGGRRGRRLGPALVIDPINPTTLLIRRIPMQHAARDRGGRPAAGECAPLSGDRDDLLRRSGALPPQLSSSQGLGGGSVFGCRQGVSFQPPSTPWFSALLMRLGLTAHPGFESRSLRCTAELRLQLIHHPQIACVAKRSWLLGHWRGSARSTASRPERSLCPHRRALPAPVHSHADREQCDQGRFLPM